MRTSRLEHLQHDLRNCRIINRLVYNYGDKPVPISEYSWKNGESEVFQCQAYFGAGDRIWTFTFTSDEAGYPGGQGQHTRPHLPVLTGQ